MNKKEFREFVGDQELSMALTFLRGDIELLLKKIDVLLIKTQLDGQRINFP